MDKANNPYKKGYVERASGMVDTEVVMNRVAERSLHLKGQLPDANMHALYQEPKSVTQYAQVQKLAIAPSSTLTRKVVRDPALELVCMLVGVLGGLSTLCVAGFTDAFGGFSLLMGLVGTALTLFSCLSPLFEEPANKLPKKQLRK